MIIRVCLSLIHTGEGDHLTQVLSAELALGERGHPVQLTNRMCTQMGSLLFHTYLVTDFSDKMWPLFFCSFSDS